MTDTRLPEYFLTSPVLDSLTDAAFRVFINGLVCSVAHGTDGHLNTRALRLLHPDGPRYDLVEDLLAIGLWRAVDGGYEIAKFLDHQSSAEQVAKGRAADRERKRRQREREAGQGDVTP